MSAAKKPASASDAEKVGAALKALADAHDALAVAYARFIDDDVSSALDSLGIDQAAANTLENAFDSMSDLSKDAARSLREVQIDRASAMRSTLKAQRICCDALKAVHTKAKDALAKKSDAKTIAAEKAATEPLEKAELVLSENEEKEPRYVAAVVQASLRELAHIEATFHAGCLQLATTTMVAFPTPKLRESGPVGTSLGLS